MSILNLKKGLNKCSLLGILLVFCITSGFSQVVINKVFSDGVFELKNTGDTEIDVSTLWICNRPAYEQIANLTVECGNFLMQPNDVVVISGFNSNFDVNDSELGLYVNTAFSSPTSLWSYVEWGSTGHGRSSVAVTAGRWTTGDFAPSFMAGQALEYDGAGNEASDWNLNTTASFCAISPIAEAQTIVALGAAEAGKTVAEWTGSERGFPEEYANFLPSVIALDDLRDPTKANATLPIYEGVGPSGNPTYFIITEASTMAVAKAYGAILAPKLIYGNRPESAAAAQYVDVIDGRIHFKGDVDFSPERILEPGSPNPFPPAVAQPGAVGDAEYSSLVVLPSGHVINAQIIANASGIHDRINDINISERWANFQLLDGWEGGDQYYYHLVTDASDPGPATIELGVYAPRMANLPVFGNSSLDGESVLLGFSPNVNGLTIALDGADETTRQGLGSTIVDNDLDPVNIFPFDPDNSVEEGNNYSPMWDAHLNMWTDEAINGPNGDQRRQITSFGDLFDLMGQGLVTSFAGSPGQENAFLNGLRASHAVINCPVICHPFQGSNTAGCQAPVDPLVLVLAPRKIQITWDEVTNAEGYLIQIRFKGQNRIAAQGILRNPKVLIFAPSNRDYEFRLQTICKDGSKSPFTAFYDFSTPQGFKVSNAAESRNAEVFQADIDLVDSESEQLIKIYPNPVSDFLNIEYQTASEASTLSIFHISGKRIEIQKLANQTRFHHIDMSKLQTGQYLLTIEEKGKPVKTMRIQKINK